MTGALEVAAKFSAAGIRSVVAAKPLTDTDVSVVVYDTETRHLSPASAEQTVSRFIAESSEFRPDLIYKKTDSTLRGNISSELRALAQLFPNWRIGYAPAYPALGRTVRDGILYVDGIPVSETVFAHDALNPVRVSSVAALLESHLTPTIFDGEHDIQLEEVTRTIMADKTMRIVVGPGGLAGTLANQLDMPRRTPPALPAVRSCLVLNGSRHECSMRQILEAAAPGWNVLERSPIGGCDPVEVAKANGKYLVQQVIEDDPDAVFIIGGDTTFAVVAELGLPPLWPLREIVAGVPVTRIDHADLKQILPERTRDLFLITKAGGFGESDVIRQVRQRLNTDAQ
jgi:uncharacterized protein YgbK (DUF1537 family)